jgi:hypothetical protein
LGFFKIEEIVLRNYFPRLTLNLNPPGLCVITGINHQCLPPQFVFYRKGILMMLLSGVLRGLSERLQVKA